MTSDTWQFIADMVDGKTPIKRSNPKPGESAYYYLNPNDDLTNATWFTERQQADVNSPDDPNPFVTGTASSGATGTGSSATTPTGTGTITSGGFDTSKWMSAFQKPTSSTVGAGTTNTGFGSTTSPTGLGSMNTGTTGFSSTPTTGTSFGTTSTTTPTAVPITRTYEDIPPLGFGNRYPEDTQTEEQKRKDNPFYDAVLKYAENNNTQFGGNGMNSQLQSSRASNDISLLQTPISYEEERQALDLNRYVESNPPKKFSPVAYTYWNTEPKDFNELKHRAILNLIESEGKDVYWAYIDPVGVPTWGPGLSFKKPEDLDGWTLYNMDDLRNGNKIPIDKSEKDILFRTIEAYRDNICKPTGKQDAQNYEIYYCPKIKMGQYQNEFQKIQMLPDDIYNLMNKRLNEDYKLITKSLANVDMKPEDFGPAGNELFFNRAYHTGRGPSGMRDFSKNVHSNDWEAIAKGMINNSVGKARAQHYMNLGRQEKVYQDKLREQKM